MLLNRVSREESKSSLDWKGTSLVAPLLKNPPAMPESPVQFLFQEDPLDRDRLPTPVFLGFPGGSDGKEYSCNERDMGLIPGLERLPGEGHGNPFQYSCLENFHGQRKLGGYSPWGYRIGHDWVTKHSTAQELDRHQPTNFNGGMIWNMLMWRMYPWCPWWQHLEFWKLGIITN